MRNRNRTKFVVIATFILFACACKKEEPVSTSTPGVFHLDATINGNTQYLEAGQNDYYMFTSYMQDANNVYNFRGELAPYSCNTCGNRFKVTINDFTATNVGGFAQIGTSLAPGYFPFAYYGGAPVQYDVTFNTASTNGNPNSIDWDFGDGTTLTNYANPTHTYARPGKYLVTMHSNFGNDTSDVSYNVNIGIPDRLCSCSFAPTNISGTGMQFNASAYSLSGITAYLWDFGDGNTSAAANIYHTYSSPGVYAVKLWVEDAEGHTTEFMRHVATQSSGDAYTDFYPATITPVPNPQFLWNVIIEWTDANGVSYTSNNPHQRTASFFKVIENDPYDANSNGQSTRKIKFQFNCELYSSSDSIPANGYAILGVAYH